MNGRAYVHSLHCVEQDLHQGRRFRDLAVLQQSLGSRHSIYFLLECRDAHLVLTEQICIMYQLKNLKTVDRSFMNHSFAVCH